ncbi:hypothetical protein L3V83_08360 [Thiotrichales bacterium 19X7-9]|nr:hypothetical protein [Thiotrichales bacterium 19X7-9]
MPNIRYDINSANVIGLDQTMRLSGYPKIKGQYNNCWLISSAIAYGGDFGRARDHIIKTLGENYSVSLEVNGLPNDRKGEAILEKSGLKKLDLSSLTKSELFDTLKQVSGPIIMIRPSVSKAGSVHAEAVVGFDTESGLLSVYDTAMAEITNYWTLNDLITDAQRKNESLRFYIPNERLANFSSTIQSTQPQKPFHETESAKPRKSICPDGCIIL